MGGGFRSTVAVAAAVLVLSGGASAQTVTGTMQGTVTDSSGAILPGVTVNIRSLDTSQARPVVTNDAGFYSAPFLPLGRYRVTAALSGFGPIARETEITLNETRVVNFRLDPRAVTQEVTVTAEAPRINTTNAEVKGSMSSQEIEDKPTANPGSFLSLAEIFTGFQENPTSGQNNPTASSGSSINFNGTGTRGATFQINGVNNDDSSENQHRQGAAILTIKEFQVITNNFTAEFGRGYGAVVLVQTKSGTNQVHGDLYNFHQNSDLNAKNFFTSAAARKPVNRRNQYGVIAGFPVKRNLLFAFLSLDRTERTGENPTPYVRDLFLPSELAAPRLTRGNDTPGNRAFIQNILSRFPARMTPNDARSPRTFAGTVGIDQPQQDYSTRLDWTPRGSQTLTARWQYTRQIFDNEEGIVGEATRQNNRQVNIGTSWTHVLSPRTVGEFRYGLGIRATRVDIKQGNDTPIVRFNQTPVTGTTLGSAGNFPIHRDQRDHQLVYNLSTIFGSNHQFKTGADMRYQQLDDFADNFSRGFWTFSTACGGQTYATSYLAFLDGCVASYQKAWGPFFLENRINESNVYVEDNWKVQKNLTVNLGLRYEYVAAPREVGDRIDYGFSADTDNIQPRLGVAWSPEWEGGWLGRLTGGAGNASVRGGYGLYDGRLFQSIFSQGGASVRTNPPNAILRTFSTQPGILNVSDPTVGFVFVPGPQTVRHAIAIVSPDLEMPRTHQWNLTLERTIRWDSTIRLTYAGNRGVGLLKYAQVNLPTSPLVAGGALVVDHPNNAPAAGFPDLRGRRIDRVAADTLCAGTGLPGIGVTAACPNAVPIADNEVSFRVPRTNERRPDPRYTTNTAVSNDAQSWYDGLQIEWVKRYRGGLQFRASYTWSKALDTGSEATFVGAGDSNFTGPLRNLAKGHSRFHTPHRLTLNGSYLLPFLRGRNDLIETFFGGWQVSGVVKLASGTPFTIVDGTGRDLNFDGFAERPVLLDPTILGRSVDHPDISTQQLPSAAFRSALPADFGRNLVARNAFFADGVNGVDLGLYKNFRMPARGHQLSVRMELYNALNQVQFGFPTTDIASAAFGRITGTSVQYGPRVVQIALRYRF